jgi:hypothetical protein
MVVLTCGQPMTTFYNYFNKCIIRLSTILSLIFFVFIFSESCRQTNEKEITIVWQGKRANGIYIPKPLLNDEPENSVIRYLQVRLENKDVSVMGAYKVRNEHILFEPLIALSPGMRYDVFLKNRFIGSVRVPLPNYEDGPKLVAIYPSADTLPENLLKFYIDFSVPMREGEALQHISLINDRNDTLPYVFLNLQPELWNKERTTLTIWLDPGRIKRELIPNLKMGNPLKKGSVYRLTISNKWKDAQGLPLQQYYSKEFIVYNRDSVSPLPQNWLLNIPAKQTVDPLQIYLNEPLDYFLLQETIQIIDEKGISVAGTISITQKERCLNFRPLNVWQQGRYRIKVASYLEDLAGNNLNRLFDRDIRIQSSQKEGEFQEKEFIIK